MSPIRGSSQALRAGFLLLDPATGTLSKIIEFPFNPAILTRELQAAPLGSTPAEPREVLSFNLVLDASDGLANRDPLVMALGVSPLLSALELLLYGPGALDRQPVVVFVWGGNRVFPVRVLSMQITRAVVRCEAQPDPGSDRLHAAVPEECGPAGGFPGPKTLGHPPAGPRGAIVADSAWKTFGPGTHRNLNEQLRCEPETQRTRTSFSPSPSGEGGSSFVRKSRASF